MKLFARKAVLLLSFLLVCVMYAAPMVNAAPDPLNVAWFITDGTGTPIDGAHLTIYWSTSVAGPFTAMDSSVVEDKIAGIYQNPIITGYWNPDLNHGIANGDLHITSPSSYYFYVEITYDSVTEYWPQSDSIKPGDRAWTPVAASGSPSGYAASGNGFGNGPTTGYLNHPLPPPVIPEVPFGTIVSFLSMITVLVGFVGVRRFRQKSR